MLAAPSVAIDLPLKILVSEDGVGKVWISQQPRVSGRAPSTPACLAAEYRGR
jgi:uncharacterized protein (DUF302 family)